MKRLSSTSSSSGPTDKKFRISLSEVETLIRQEVESKGNKKEKKLRDMINSVQSLEQEVDYENTIQRLEARIYRLTKRAEAVLNHMTKTQEKSPVKPQDNTDVIRIDSEDDVVEIKSDPDNKKCSEKIGEISQEMKSSKEAEEKLREHNDDIESAMATHSGGIAHYSEEDTLSYPPLPSLPWPSTLSMKAVSYTIPPKVEVHLALIREPLGLSVLWKVAEEEPSAPPMDSYSIYMAIERTRGSGVFPKWNLLDELKAMPLPMCVMIKKYKPGLKLCVAVVGKDTFNRYGPFSEVVTATIPETGS